MPRAVPIDPPEAAKAAGLRYVHDDMPGITRRRAGRGFAYFDPAGHRIIDRQVVGWIKSLAIPPAWKEVWICPDPRGHLQATGRDDRGRKQHRYHPRWRQVRDAAKYHRLGDFARALPQIRRAVKRHLRQPGLQRQKVLAGLICLLETTLIRVGNDEYARHNGSFGLTTLHNGHVRVRGSKIRFRFRGKSRIHHEIDLQSPRLARLIRRCQELPGQELFAYVDEAGEVVDITSTDVNAYLHDLSGRDFTAKDFRTWAGTVEAAMALAEEGRFQSKAEAKRNINRAVERVARKLGNTRAVCRKCYIHPAVIEAYLAGKLESLPQASRTNGSAYPASLRREESAVLHLLRHAPAGRK